MRWLILLVLWLSPALVMAQPSPEATLPPIQAIPKGADKIVPLRKGQLAPFTGQLFGPNTALRWANWLQQYKYRLKWDVTAVQQKCAVETTYRDKLLTIEKTRAKRVEKDLTTRLGRSEQARLNAEEELRNPPWYSTTAFGVIIGAVATAAVFGIAVLNAAIPKHSLSVNFCQGCAT